VTDSPPPVRRWLGVAADPMDPHVVAWRQDVVREARQKPVLDRVQYLRSVCRGKRVLDVGVVDHTSSSERSDRWLHGYLVESAAEILGVDVLPDEVQALQGKGYNVQCMDLTAGALPEGKFDVLVVGEVVEHLGRPGGLFEAASQLLEPSGRMVLSTPNPYAVWRVFQNWRGRPYENADHALLLSPWGIAELSERAGLRLESFRGIAVPPVGWKARAVHGAVQRRVLPFVPEATCESIIYDVVPAKAC
jgi:SAM-dependent methyltransferase